MRTGLAALIWSGINSFLITQVQAQVPTWDQPHIRQLASSPSPSPMNQESHRLLEQQQQTQLVGQNPLYQQQTVQAGKARAEQMVEMIKSAEMEKALQKITSGTLQSYINDPGARGPLGVIAGAMSLWMGNTVRLIKNDQWNVSTRIEGRNRSSEFTMESPLLNGRFRYSADGGVEMHMNRSISSIGSQAELHYHMRQKIFSTSLRQRIAPNLDLTFGAAQAPQWMGTDGSARIEYRLDF